MKQPDRTACEPHGNPAVCTEIAHEGKVCRRCGAVKSQSEFYRRPDTRDRLQSWCKECSHERVREWEKTPDGRAAHAKARLDQGARCTPGYVRRLISNYTGIPRASIPEPLVLARRAQILANRLIKEKTK